MRTFAELFELFASIITDGVIIHRSGLILEANQAAAELLGHNCAPEILGQNIDAVARLVNQQKERVLATTDCKVGVMRVEVTRKDGRVDSLELRTSPISYLGEPAVILGIKQVGITASESVADTGDAKRSALVVTAKQITDLAHEFNNLLTAITGNVTLLRLDIDQEHPASQSVDEISDATKRASTLTKQLHSLAYKRSRGAAALEFELDEDSSATQISEGALVEKVIVLVEDDQPIRNLLAKWLTRLGADLRPVGSGEEAIELAVQLPKIDLLVTDLTLPGVGGRQIGVTIRQLHPEVRVLYTSGNQISNEEGSDALLPTETFLPKPFTPEVFEARLLSLMHASLDTQ